MHAIWLTGLSGSGKTTIAERLSDYLKNENIKHEVLDGDVYRSILSPKDGYSKEEQRSIQVKSYFHCRDSYKK